MNACPVFSCHELNSFDASAVIVLIPAVCGCFSDFLFRCQANLLSFNNHLVLFCMGRRSDHESVLHATGFVAQATSFTHNPEFMA